MEAGGSGAEACGRARGAGAAREGVGDGGGERGGDGEEDRRVFFDLVSEWNPCFSEDGEARFQWDEEVGAHDVVAMMTMRGTPERVNLRALLDRALDGQRAVDLEPVRRLVAALVQKSGRHDMHGKRAPSSKHPCARGKEGCLYCRYGFPQDLVGRGGHRTVVVSKGDAPGRWQARFCRNDALVCGHEPHVLLANMGNVDWRPCLNLWAVVEYITKYATKAPSGSRRMGEVLKDAVAEVCKYTPQEEERSVGWRSLQKFYSRMLGERDYSLFEAVHVGLGLPLMYSMMPVVSLSTLGARAMKVGKH